MPIPLHERASRGLRTGNFSVTFSVAFPRMIARGIAALFYLQINRRKKARSLDRVEVVG